MHNVQQHSLTYLLQRAPLTSWTTKWKRWKVDPWQKIKDKIYDISLSRSKICSCLIENEALPFTCPSFIPRCNDVAKCINMQIVYIFRRRIRLSRARCCRGFREVFASNLMLQRRQVLWSFDAPITVRFEISHLENGDVDGEYPITWRLCGFESYRPIHQWASFIAVYISHNPTYAGSHGTECTVTRQERAEYW